MNLDFMSEVIKLHNKNQFNALLKDHDDVLLAISEDWCSICRVMEGTLINAAFELKGKAVVVKSDIATSQSLSEQLGLRSIPAYVVFKEGEVSEVLYGRQPIQSLTKAWI
ncbi:hypothetical protein DI392_07970 [Vibrio albus]|uniref:Thioredoxin domain-containing protein n=1 Tax=Vibrio albus TaxID=2200953 RepID=A0A2U3BBF8_9VIBR|nr:thioredoxin family protein [Vibrio albus]PWI34118.1 hypothetical protein DI392_07970 [Vibrio albus]